MGNVGAVMPVIQPFTMGITGVGHAVDCQVTYPEYAVFDPAVVQASTLAVPQMRMFLLNTLRKG